MAKKPPKYGRDVMIRVRQVDLNNLNLKPEKHGVQLEPRSDLSVAFTLKRDELGLFEIPEVLWDKKGEPLLQNLASPFELALTIEGIAKVGSARGGECAEFPTARMKKIRVLPSIEWALQCTAQVRIDPENELSELNRLLCAGKCKFGFVGKVLLNSAEADDEEDPESKQIGIEDAE